MLYLNCPFFSWWGLEAKFISCFNAVNSSANAARLYATRVDYWLEKFLGERSLQLSTWINNRALKTHTWICFSYCKRTWCTFVITSSSLSSHFRRVFSFICKEYERKQLILLQDGESITKLGILITCLLGGWPLAVTEKESKGWQSKQEPNKVFIGK